LGFGEAWATAHARQSGLTLCAYPPPPLAHFIAVMLIFWRLNLTSSTCFVIFYAIPRSLLNVLETKTKKGRFLATEWLMVIFAEPL